MGSGGGEYPPTARANRMQGSDCGKEGPMGGLRTAEPPDTEIETLADDGSTGTLPRQSDGAVGAMSEHGAFAHRKYDLLASEAPDGGLSQCGGSR